MRRCCLVAMPYGLRQNRRRLLGNSENLPFSGGNRRATHSTVWLPAGWRADQRACLENIARAPLCTALRARHAPAALPTRTTYHRYPPMAVWDAGVAHTHTRLPELRMHTTFIRTCCTLLHYHPLFTQHCAALPMCCKHTPGLRNLPTACWDLLFAWTCSTASTCLRLRCLRDGLFNA